MSTNARVSAHPLVKVAVGGVLLWVGFGVYRGVSGRHRGDSPFDSYPHGRSLPPFLGPRNALSPPAHTPFPPDIMSGAVHQSGQFPHPSSYYYPSFFQRPPCCCCCCCHHVCACKKAVNDEPLRTRRSHHGMENEEKNFLGKRQKKQNPELTPADVSDPKNAA